MVKECDEEASIPEHIAEKVGLAGEIRSIIFNGVPDSNARFQSRNCGAITYFTYSENGLQPETQYIFDLQLPSDVTPKPQDGEVECFYLWTLDEVRKKKLLA